MSDNNKVQNTVLLALSIVPSLAVVMMFFGLWSFRAVMDTSEPPSWLESDWLTNILLFPLKNREITYMILGVGALGALLAMFLFHRESNEASNKGIQSVSSHVRK